MNERSLNVLEYPKIIALLKSHCVTAGGKRLAGVLKPMVLSGEIIRALDLTDEAVGMVLRNGRPPLSEIGDTDEVIRRAGIGSMLSMRELLNVALLMRITRDMDVYFTEDTQREILKNLRDYFGALDPIAFFEEEISRKILNENEMADDASVELKRIRREIVVKNARITERLNSIVSSSTYEKVLQERLITIRNHRYVVPVKQEYRQMVPGIIQDKSSSGATLFIEPMAVVQLNNELKELAIEEEKEVTRILKQLSQKTAQYREVLLCDYDILTELDFIFGKAKFALDIGGNRVKLSETGGIALLHARHPLLDAQKAVASDIVLGKGIDTMIITGPNTGGKTVTLKTIGLTCLMVQSGLFVPVREGSTLCVFNEVYADIGDEQSIEQSLSTFSSHMTHIVEIMTKAGPGTLVLLDELGAGTDPTEGAALAIALLDDLHRRGSLTCATTHYSELKEYALVTEGVTNASVEFDVASLRPTYRLLIGMPGKSNAFEIARRLGLDSDLINRAKATIEADAIQFENTLEKIEENRLMAEKAAKENAALKAEAEKILTEAKKQLALAEKGREKLMAEARSEADRLIMETKEKTDAIYKEIRLIQESTEAGVKDNKRLEALRKEMAEQEKSIYTLYKDKAKEQKRNQNDEKITVALEKGMSVHIDSLHQNGEILEMLEKENMVLVQVGMLKLKVGKDDCRPIIQEKPKMQRKRNTVKSVDRHTMDKRLDLRGRNGEEALFLVEKLISDAIVSGTDELLIVHGKGTGKLRQVIHAYLKDNPHVVDFRLGGPSEGGSGATVVKL